MGIVEAVLSELLGFALVEKVIQPAIDIAIRTAMTTLIEIVVATLTRQIIESVVDSGEHVSQSSQY